MSIIGGINLGNLTSYLFLFANGSVDANWQGATKGFLGNVAVDGLKASERTSGTVPYAGTLTTNDTSLGAWNTIVNQNPTQALAALNQAALITGLEADLVSAFLQINALPPSPTFEGVSSTSLNNLNTQDGKNQVYVINITSGFTVSTQINITGDPGDVFILRWDSDANPANGYQGQVKFHSGGAIVPHGGLTSANFLHVAGDIASSGGGQNPLPPYPQGPRQTNGTGALISGGSDWNGGGFFTGYWLTTGTPTLQDPVNGLFYGESSSMSNGIFVGGWYTLNTKFSMTSGTSGVYIAPNPATFPSLAVKKEVSGDGGVTWLDANTPTGPNILSPISPQFRFTATNTGNVALTGVAVTDNVYGAIGTVPALPPGASATPWVITKPWAAGQQQNTATVTAKFQTNTLTATDTAYWFGVETPTPALRVLKEVSPDNGLTWADANTAPGPTVPASVSPRFRFTVTNTGNVALTGVQVTDDVYGTIGTVPTLAPGTSATPWVITRPWLNGQQQNIATATGSFNTQTLTATDPAYWLGVAAPAISILKEVSPDGGTVWSDANVAPGPSVPTGTNPMFRFTVTNIGDVPLTGVQVNDTIYGFVGPLPDLAPGATAALTHTGTWALGQQMNTATASGTYGGKTVTGADSAYWVGIVPEMPSVGIVKYVSVDNGATWETANTPPGPLLPSGTTPQFKIVVTNTGNVLLTDLVVTDNVLGAVGTLTSLAPGASSQWVLP